MNESLPETLWLDQALSFFLNAAFAIALVIAGWFLAKKLSQIAVRLMTRSGIDTTISGFVSNAAFFLVLIVIAIASLSLLGVPTASFIAALGAAGLAVGLALQGSLSNIAAGFLLIVFRPCKAGDYIEANGVSGTVTAVSLFSTTLLTPDQRTIVVPNAGMIGGPITNYSTSPVRRLDMVFSISHDSDLPKAMQLLRDIVSADDRVLEEHEVQIGVLNIGANSVDIAVRPWVSSADYWALHFDLHENIKLAFDQAGITLLVPPVLSTSAV